MRENTEGPPPASEHPVALGRPRGSGDGCRRYRPIRVTFDTRNLILDVEIREDWDTETKSMWETSKAQVRAELVAELGPARAAQKLDNYRAMGPAPWSVVFEHSALLAQIRSSFAHGDFYPALVGACALGERLLHQLVLALKVDFPNHPATTKRVRSGSLPNSWGALITVLAGWGVFDEEVADLYRDLEQRRHAAVHFDPTLRADGRESALGALLALQKIVEQVFEPHGGPPRYIADTPGASYLSLEAEKEPIIRRIFIPNCVLVGPVHRLEPDRSVPGGWRVYDSEDPCESLTDEQFAQCLREGNAGETTGAS